MGKNKIFCYYLFSFKEEKKYMMVKTILKDIKLIFEYFVSISFIIVPLIKAYLCCCSSCLLQKRMRDHCLALFSLFYYIT